MKSPKSPGKPTVILIHSIAWILAFCLPFLLRTSNLSPRPVFELTSGNLGWVFLYIIKAIIWMSFFYFTYFILIPLFVKKQKYFKYLLLQLFSLACICIASFGLLSLFIPGYHYSRKNLNNIIYYNTIPFVFVLAGCFIWQLYEEKIKSDTTNLDEEKKHLMKEIEKMRAKVSPGFVYSSLNTLLYLFRSKNDQFEDGALQLLSLVEYMLADATDNKIPLTREIEYLEKYLAFVRRRSPSSIVLHVEDNIVQSNDAVDHLVLLHYAEDTITNTSYSTQKEQLEIWLYKKNNLLTFIVYKVPLANNTPVNDKVQQAAHVMQHRLAIRKLMINTYNAN
ncbi:MAG TPA: histidine kinase [Chitinophagaceae bacterium]|nr:histidine kinase [Chitinophagaceae bacterium]